MNNPNPFVPKGSLLEQQSKSRSSMKLGVLCVVAVGALSLAAMLIQGCKREKEETDAAQAQAPETNAMVVDTNAPIAASTNGMALAPQPAPQPLQQQVVIAPPVENPESTYVVVRNDTLGKIAKKHGVSLRALQSANPGVESAHLKVGQKLAIPAGGTAPASAGGVAAPVETGAAGVVYVVKSGDNLSKIAKKHGVSLKAIRSENNLSTDHIKVGQKLKIPSTASAAPAPIETVPAQAPAAPAAPVVTPAPAPGN
jgi:LysM repeat protein